MFGISTNAQTQQGIVKTRGRMVNGQLVPGTRLSGATITLNFGNPLVSGNKGAFSFTLPTAKTYSLVSATKQGYTLADPEYTRRSFSYSAKSPFYVVLENENQRQADINAATRKVRRTLTAQLQKREDEIEELKAQNKLTETDYQKRLQQLYDNQSKSEQLVKEMAERYASTDYDQLDEFNRQVQMYIEEGELQKADSMIRSKGNIEQRVAEYYNVVAANKKEREQLKQREQKLEQSESGAAKTYEDLSQDLLRQSEIFLQKFQQDSALYCLKIRADLDTTNIKAVKEYADLCYKQKKFTESENYFQMCLRAYICNNDSLQIAVIQNSLGTVHCLANNFVNGERLYNSSLEIIEQLFKQSPDAYRENLAVAQNNLGNLYLNLHNYKTSEKYYKLALENREQLFKQNPGVYRECLATTQNNLGVLYHTIRDYENSEKYYKLALGNREQLFKRDSDTHRASLADTQNNLGALYRVLRDNESSMKYYMLALENRGKLFNENPDAYCPALAKTQNHIGILYRTMRDYVNCEKFYILSLRNYERLFKRNPNAYRTDLAGLQNNLAILYHVLHDFANGEKYYKLALENREELFKQNPKAFRKDLASLQDNIGSFYRDFKDYAKFVNLFTNFMKQAPDNMDYVLQQYDVLSKAEDSFIDRKDHKIHDDELVLVVDKNVTLTDLTLAEIGLFGHDEFIHIAEKAIEEQKIRKDESLTPAQKEEKINDLDSDDRYSYRKDFEYSDLIGREYEYFPQEKIYTKGDIDTGEIEIVLNGIDTGTYSSYNMVFDLESDVWEGTYTDIVNFMSPTALKFERKSAKPSAEVVGINRALGDWEFVDGETVYSFTISNLLSPSLPITKDSITINYLNLTTEGMKPVVYENPLKVLDAWNYSALKDPVWGEGKKLKISAILKLNEQNKFGSLERGIYYSKEFTDLFITDSNKTSGSPLTDAMKANINGDGSALNAYVTFTYYSHKKDKMITSYANCLNGDMSSSFSELLGGFGGGSGFETDKTHLRSISGLKVEKINNEYVYDLVPKSVSIYPNSFEAKNEVKDYLNKWNDDAPLTFISKGAEKTIAAGRDELTVTDTIEMIISIINTLINAITTALVVFTSLSLVVSCFMIAVITYISVVERIKEIGIIRSLGGRKRDVASLFTMENLLTGLFSGLFGIAITYLLQLILNVVLKSMFQITIANLTIPTALIMIGVSILLSVVSGFIPSQSAAHKDPVIALRSAE